MTDKGRMQTRVPKEKIKDAGVELFWTDDLKNGHKSEAYKLVAKISELQKAPASNAYIQLKEWKKVGDKMIDYILAVSNYVRVQTEHWDRLNTDCVSKKYRRWSKEEDEVLIDLVCSGISQSELSATMGRTIPAIKTRVSKLVGEKRISQKVAGDFFGTLNGEYIEGKINGEVKND